MYSTQGPYRDNGDRHRKRYRDDRHHGNDYGKRRDAYPARSHEEESQDRLKQNLISLGDSHAEITLKQDIERVATIVEKEWSERSAFIIDLLRVCIRELPMKTPLFGTLAGVLNARNSEIGQAIVEHMFKYLQLTLEERDWKTLKLAVRFFAEMTNAKVLPPSELLSLLGQFVAVALDESTPQPRVDTFLRIVLSALPYVGAELNTELPEELKKMLSTIEAYMGRREQLNLSIVKVYSGGDPPFEQRETFGLLWKQVKHLEMMGWDEPDLLKPYKSFILAPFVSPDTQSHMPQLTIPSHEDSFVYTKPSYQFLLRQETSVRVPDPESISQFVIEDVVRDTLQTYEVNRKESSRYVNHLRYFFADGTFVEQSHPQQMNGEDDTEMNNDDGSVNGHPSEPHYSLEDLIIEGAFSEMFTLPEPLYNNVYYHALIMEMCKQNPSDIAPALGRAVHCLYARVDQMDPECIYRFYDVFAHHLSNFNFAWNWKNWSSAMEENGLHPKLVFIRETLEKELRLSYYERVKTSLPDDMAGVFIDGPPTANFTYELPNHPLNQAASAIIKVLRSRGDEVAVIEAARDITNALPDLTEAQQEDITRDVVTQCMLMLGSKSFSHVLNIIERNLQLLQHSNAATPRSRRHTVLIVAEFWKHNPQFMAILLDRLLNYRVIDPMAIISWLFGAETDDNFTVIRQPSDPSDEVGPKPLPNVAAIMVDNEISRSHTWEILTATLNKVVARSSAKKTTASDANGNDTHMDGDTNGETSKPGDATEAANEVYRAMLTRFSALTANDERDWWKWWARGVFRDIVRLYHSNLPMDALDEISGDEAIIEACNEARKMKSMGY